MARWQRLIEDIQLQLKPSIIGGNFHEKEMDARKAIADAATSGDEIESRSAMGRIGGLHRRWARMLVVSLTDCALAGRDTSRHKTRAWQQRVFGQSVSSNALSMYGTQARSGGGRSDFKEPGHEVDAKAKEIFDRYKDALKKLQVKIPAFELARKDIHISLSVCERLDDVLPCLQVGLGFRWLLCSPGNGVVRANLFCQCTDFIDVLGVDRDVSEFSTWINGFAK